MQQRQGRVKRTMPFQGLPLNAEPSLEQEASALGLKAAHNVSLGLSYASAASARPAQATYGTVVQAQWDWPWNWGWLPWNWNWGGASTTKTMTRPKKPKRFTGYTDSRGNPLAFHHKYPSNEILAEAQSSTGSTKQAQELREKLKAWGSRPDLDEIGPSLAWTSHNVFPGPLPENRPDDPEKDPLGIRIDTHFTKSGTVTPKSELALEIAVAGGIGKLDLEELNERLEALADREASGYESEEWEGPPKARRQKGKPKNWGQWDINKRLTYAQSKHKK
jgi:hypothetical protein